MKEFSHTHSQSVDGNDRAKLVPIADMVQMCAVYMLYVLFVCCFVVSSIYSKIHFAVSLVY